MGRTACTETQYLYKSAFYLFTYSMVQSPSEANWFAASQEIPRISRNPKVHYRTHKCPPPVFILGQPNPVHIFTSHLLEIHSNIIHPSMPRSPQWSPSLRFPHQDPIHHPLLTHMHHMPSPFHSSWFYHPHNIGWEIQIINSSLCNLLHSHVTSSLLGLPQCQRPRVCFTFTSFYTYSQFGEVYKINGNIVL